MEAAVAFSETRVEQRIEELAKKRVLSAEPLIELLAALSSDRAKLAEYFAPTEVIDSFRARLLRACEDAADLGWLPPSEIAPMVGKTADTVREWCRQGKVLHTEGSNGYMVNVRSALKFAGVLT